MSKPAHHSGTYQTDRNNVVAIASANHLTLCWSCQRPLSLHPPHANGRPAAWTGGHTQRGSATAHPWLRPMVSPTDCAEAAAGDWLAPEASTCNYADRDRNPDQIVTTRRW